MRLLLRLPRLAFFSATCASLSACLDGQDRVAAPLVRVQIPETAIPYNHSARIAWHATGGEVCAASEGWSGELGPEGELEIGPLVSDQEFALRCRGAGGATAQAVRLSVAPPQLQFELSRVSTEPGQAVIAAWHSSVNGTCFATSRPEGLWQGDVGPSGMQVIAGAASDAELSLTCSDGLHSVSKQIALRVGPAKPRITLASSNEKSAFGDEVVLRWSVENAKRCEAHGDWTGRQPMSGELTLAVFRPQRFVLECAGPGGTAREEARVALTSSGKPHVRLQVSPPRVERGGTITVQWSGQNIERCSAEGDWSGDKGALGVESFENLQASRRFVLRCRSAQGEVVAVQQAHVEASPQIQGTVDSSLVPVHGDVELHVFAGAGYDSQSVSPARLSRRAAVQERACGFRYTLEAMDPGSYTLGLYDRVANAYLALHELTVDGSGRGVDFPPRRVLTVGAQGGYPDIGQALAAAQPGDLIEIEAGVYRDHFVTLNVSGITVRAVAGHAHFVPADYHLPPGSPPLWQVEADGVRLENLAFAGASADDGTGIGVSASGKDVAVCNAYFYDNDSGMVSTAAQTRVTFSEFDANVQSGNPSGSQLWVDGERLVLNGNYFHGPLAGTQVRSSARVNEISYNEVIDGKKGRSLHSFEFPGAGRATLIGNVIEKGPRNSANAMIIFGGASIEVNARHRLTLVNNTVIANASVVAAVQDGASAVFVNNIASGSAGWADGAAKQRGNLDVPSWSFVDAERYDFRLRADSPAINNADAPLSVEGVTLAPHWEFQRCCALRPRASDGALDVGAFEY